jgi:hypothetical protein
MAFWRLPGPFERKIDRQNSRPASQMKVNDATMKWIAINPEIEQ